MWHMLRINETDVNATYILIKLLFDYLQIVLGRKTVESKVDANLMEEGSCSKVSKKQAVIRLKDMGRFIIFNKGLLPIFVDKRAVPFRCAARLHNQSVIQV
jgi:hypothetical protein